MPIPIRPAVSALPAYAAGKPPRAGPAGIGYKLSSNENPYPPLPGVLAEVAKAAAGMNRYPDAGNTAIADAVARRLGVSAGQVAFGAGSVAVLYHLLQATCAPGDEVVFAWRSFEAYPIAVQLTGATAVPVPLGPGAVHDLDAMRAAVTDRTRAIMICTPNNPTGPVVPHDDLVSFVDSLPDDVMIMIDEAYVEYVRNVGAARGLEIAAGRDNVVVLRTFSKAYGLAGFRVGYCIGDPTVAAATRAVALPFGVSVTAQAAVLASLRAETELMDRVHDVVVQRDLVLAGLRQHGFDVPDTQGNFVWLPAGERTTAWAVAFGEVGLSVRPYVAGADDDGIRISIGEPEANQLVLQAAATLT